MKRITNAERYEFWRDNSGCGIAVGDAPLDYRSGKELDEYTDECIRRYRKALKETVKKGGKHK